MEYEHKPVLLNEVLEGLNLSDGATYVDCTLGGSGHALAALNLKKNIKLIGFDQDQEAIKVSTKRLAGKNAKLFNLNFKEAPRILDELNVQPDAVLADLGVSSYQIDNPQRGFSFRFDAPLDMRMDLSQSLSAKDVVNNYSLENLKNIIKDYGEEKFAASIARKIVEERAKNQITTTKQLEKIILSAVPRYKHNDGSSNVQRTFQAIRIEVNQELTELDQFIRDMTSRLKKGGRLLIISFHSLEDRIVKHTFKELATGCTCPKDFPVCVCGKKPVVKLITNHPIVATEQEAHENRRSSSAKLRIIEKL